MLVRDCMYVLTRTTFFIQSKQNVSDVCKAYELIDDFQPLQDPITKADYSCGTILTFTLKLKHVFIIQQKKIF